MTKREIFSAIGRVSVLFSSLEAELEDLLCILADPEDPMLAATLVEGVSFAKILELLKKVVRFKDGAIEGKVLRLLDISTPLRSKRNLFVHGYWDMSEELLNHGKVTVRDSKIRFQAIGTRKSWRKGTDYTITYDDLRGYETEIMRALKITKELLKELRDDRDI